MTKVRVYDLAKECGMDNKELVEKLKALGQDVKSPSSTIPGDVAAKMRGMIGKGEKKDGAGKNDSAADQGEVTARRPTVILRARRPEPPVEEPPSPAPNEGEAVAAPVEKSDERAKSVDSEKPFRPELHAGFARVVRAPNNQILDEPADESIDSSENGLAGQTPAGNNAATKEETSDPALTVQSDPSVMVSAMAVPPPTATQPTAGMEKAAPASPKSGKRQDRTYVPPTQKKSKPAPNNNARVIGTIALGGGTGNNKDGGGRHRLPGRQTAPGGKPGNRNANGEAGVERRPERKPARPGEVVAVPPGDDGRFRKGGKGRRGQDGDDMQDRRSSGKSGPKKTGPAGKFNSFNDEYQYSGGKRGKKQKRRLEEKPITAEMKASKRKVRVFGSIAVGALAAEMSIKASEVIAKLMKLGIMATVNQSIDLDTATLIASDFGYEIEEGITEERGIELFEEAETGGERLPRPPVVTVMGHVDHGKTSILDAIRKTDVALGEAGGITQHIGAYHVRSKAGDVTFIDTPGHAAFTEMRSRGAQITDLVILVVAADDGVKEQTKEAINHAQAAGVEILVAVNKIDKPGADIDRVKRELSDFGLIPEEWGGKTIYCETSAKQRIGIDELMEAIQLVAEMKELKADPKRKAKGRVIEAKLDKGRGAVATVIVEEGTLKNGEYLVVGQYSGKVRAMFDDKARKIKAAGPSIPVEIQGLSGVPSAGDEFLAVADEKMAKNVSQARSMKAREAELGASSKISLDKLFDRMNEGEVQELRLIIRADVQGTLEAFAKAAQELSTKDIKVRVLHEGTGTISDSDILLASASDAIVLGFNVRPTVKVKELAARENVDVRSYDVIYHALDDIRKAMLGMLEPTFTEDVIGLAEVRNTFNVPKVGTIAGCFIQEGKVIRNARVRVLREGVVVYIGKISSLRRFKDDAREVVAGYECGIGVENYNDIKIGDNLEAFLMQEVEATLE